jgi:hypothetical protein
VINQKTVFILGAGASVPYNFPSAAQLRNYLTTSFLGEYETVYRKIAGGDNVLKEVMSQFEGLITAFRKSSIISIDRFLAQNDDPNIIAHGKLAIAFSILKYEISSKFREHILNQDYDWYTYIFNQMMDRGSPSSSFDISKNKISFITFNYDRSLEHILWESYQHSFTKMSAEDKNNKLSNVPIYHVYGSLGALPWQSDNESIPYGYDDLLWYRQAAQGISIIHETVNDPRDISEHLRTRISLAENIYFLGFGFDVSNLKKIGIPESINKDQMIYGTAYDMLDAEVNRVYAALGRTKNNKNTHILKCDSRELLRKFLF